MPTPPFTAAPAQPPEPHQASAQAVSPTYTARLLGLVRKLIDFGQEIAAAAQQRPTGEDRTPLTRRFGTKSIALILASIARGLRFAAKLEERLGGPPARLNPAHATAAGLSPRKPRVPRPASRPQGRVPTGLTAKDIAAWARHYPLETVLIHIRSYLGLTPDDPLWQQVNDILIEHHADRVRNAQDQTAATNTRSQETGTRGSNHASPREPDTQTKSHYRASLMRGTTLLPPDTLLRPLPAPRQPSAHPVSVATSGAGPPRKVA